MVVERLEAAGIEYMLTGSVAMAWYAQPRQTRDIDIVVELPPKWFPASVSPLFPQKTWFLRSSAGPLRESPIFK